MTTCFDCGGRTGFGARVAAGPGRGLCDRFCWSAPPAGIKRRSRPERYSRILASRSLRGSEPCGGSPVRRTEPVPWACRGCWDWEVTRQLGRGCTNCGGRWCVRDAIGSRAQSRWTRPILEVRKRALAGDRRKPRPWLSLLRKRMAGVLDASGCAAYPTRRRRVCSPLWRRLSSLVVPFTRMAGLDTIQWNPGDMFTG